MLRMCYYYHYYSLLGRQRLGCALLQQLEELWHCIRRVKCVVINETLGVIWEDENGERDVMRCVIGLFRSLAGLYGV